MYVEKIVKKQEKERLAEEKRLTRLERQQTQWTIKREKEKKQRADLYEAYYKLAQEDLAKFGTPKDPGGNLRAILRETHRVNISYLNAGYELSEPLRWLITLSALIILTGGVGLVIGVTHPFTTLEAQVTWPILCGAFAFLVYFTAPPVARFFVLRKKLKIAAECQAAVEAIEKSEPLPTD